MQTNHLQNLYKVSTVLVIILSILALIYSYGQLKANGLIGASAQNTITITGNGKVDAKPDLATVTATLRENGKTTKEAQDKLALKWSKASPAVKDLIDEKDIKTSGYTTYPKYVYTTTGKASIESYEASQTIEFKIRKTDDTSKIINILSTNGINEVSGPNFSIDEPEKLQEIARAEAITDARTKAKKLAAQLGVDIGRIVSFTEDTGMSTPIAYMSRDMERSKTASAPAPEIQTGQQTIESNVSITFEIK